jgi:hypothetical protein
MQRAGHPRQQVSLQRLPALDLHHAVVSRPQNRPPVICVLMQLVLLLRTLDSPLPILT